MNKSVKTVLYFAAFAASATMIASTAFGIDIIGTPGHRAMAPEIDPASAVSALTLLASGVAVLRSRFKK